MIGTFELGGMIILFLLVCIAVFFYVVSYRFGNTLETATITRGLNAKSGQRLHLSCPTGKVIKLERVNYVCSNATGPNGSEGSGYDPVSNGMPDDGNKNSTDVYGAFNTKTTLDASSDPNLAACVGKQYCDFVVPSTFTFPPYGNQPAPVNCDNGKDAWLIGSYDCVSA